MGEVGYLRLITRSPNPNEPMHGVQVDGLNHWNLKVRCRVLDHPIRLRPPLHPRFRVLRKGRPSGPEPQD